MRVQSAVVAGLDVVLDSRGMYGSCRDSERPGAGCWRSVAVGQGGPGYEHEPSRVGVQANPTGMTYAGSRRAAESS
jgi:hypothetical protein